MFLMLCPIDGRHAASGRAISQVKPQVMAPMLLSLTPARERC
jgi:hypothetical protein